VQIKRRIEEKNKLLRTMAAGGSGKDAAFAVVDVTEVMRAGLLVLLDANCWMFYWI
jgi:hypothetical protein